MKIITGIRVNVAKTLTKNVAFSSVVFSFMTISLPLIVDPTVTNLDAEAGGVVSWFLKVLVASRLKEEEVSSTICIPTDSCNRDTAFSRAPPFMECI